MGLTVISEPGPPRTAHQPSPRADPVCAQLCLRAWRAPSLVGSQFLSTGAVHLGPGQAPAGTI